MSFCEELKATVCYSNAGHIYSLCHSELTPKTLCRPDSCCNNYKLCSRLVNCNKTGYGCTCSSMFTQQFYETPKDDKALVLLYFSFFLNDWSPQWKSIGKSQKTFQLMLFKHWLPPVNSLPGTLTDKCFKQKLRSMEQSPRKIPNMLLKCRSTL